MTAIVGASLDGARMIRELRARLPTMSIDNAFGHACSCLTTYVLVEIFSATCDSMGSRNRRCKMTPVDILAALDHHSAMQELFDVRELAILPLTASHTPDFDVVPAILQIACPTMRVSAHVPPIADRIIHAFIDMIAAYIRAHPLGMMTDVSAYVRAMCHALMPARLYETGVSAALQDI